MKCFPTQMSLMSLLALPSGLKIRACSQFEGRLDVSLLSTQPSSPCPLCGTAATRVHSRYQRRLADLPSAGQSVCILLPHRKAETAAAWMRSHPEIRLVSRDRGGDYAAAALAAAPQAVQCADRFHVLTNLSKSVEGLLSRHLAAHRTRVDLESRATSLSTAEAQSAAEKESKARTGEPGEARRAPGSIPASGGLAPTWLLANGHRCSGRSRSCNRLTLFEQWHFP